MVARKGQVFVAELGWALAGVMELELVKGWADQWALEMVPVLVDWLVWV